MTVPVPEGPPGELERMLGIETVDPVIRRAFDKMRGEDSTSDRKLPERPQQPHMGSSLLALTPDDMILVQFSVDDKVVHTATFNAAQAALFYDNFGKLLDKIRPRT